MLVRVLVRVSHYISLIGKVELKTVPISERMFKGLAIMNLSLDCSQILFSFYTDSKGQEKSTWVPTRSLAIGMAFTANMVFAVLTCLCFGENIMANILLDFPSEFDL